MECISDRKKKWKRGRLKRHLALTETQAEFPEEEIERIRGKYSDIMAQKFSELIKHKNSWRQEAQQIQSRINKNKFSPKHIFKLTL